MALSQKGSALAGRKTGQGRQDLVMREGFPIAVNPTDGGSDVDGGDMEALFWARYINTYFTMAEKGLQPRKLFAVSGGVYRQLNTGRGRARSLSSLPTLASSKFFPNVSLWVPDMNHTAPIHSYPFERLPKVCQLWLNDPRPEWHNSTNQ